MQTKMKFKLKGIMLVAAALLLASACSSNNSSSGSSTAGEASSQQAATKSELPPVKLVWYYLNATDQPDLKLVESEVNKYIQPKINATVELKPVAAAEYDQKMNTVLASGEEFDLVFTSDWKFLYQSNASKGAFLALDDLMAKDAPGLKSMYKDYVWDDIRLKDKLYAVPNYQVAAKASGFAIQKRWIDKYQIDVSKIKTYQDMEPIFAKLSKEPNVIPFGIGGTGQQFFDPKVYGYESVNNVDLRKTASGYTVVDMVQTPEYKQYVELAHSWFTKGYINDDAATIKNLGDLQKTGKLAVTYGYTLQPGSEAIVKANSGGNDIVFAPMTKPEYTGVQAALTAISHTSKNPDRAMMLIDLIHKDAYLYNLLSFGIEGKHYTKLGNNTIKVIPDGGYNPNRNWVMGDVTVGYLIEGQSPDQWDRIKQYNDSADRSKLFGFKFDETNVKTEIANLKAVENQFKRVLETGTVDPAEYLPQYIAKRKSAGIDKVLAEQQKQIDEWVKTNVK